VLRRAGRGQIVPGDLKGGKKMAKALAIVGKAAFIIGVLFAIFCGIWGGVSVPTNKVVS